MPEPNIVFVLADQLRSMDLGCYGGEQVHTPMLDQLASEGVVFTNAYSTVPVCSPYRAMLMTGNYPMTNGMVMCDHFLRNPTPYFAEVCKSNGYNTGYIGKWHLDGRGREAYIPPQRRCGFDYWRALECTHEYTESKYYYQEERTARTWKGFDTIAQTEEACNFIREKSSSDDPFLLFLSWGPPHDPYTAPGEYLDRFDPDTIQLRGNVDDFTFAENMHRECDTVLSENFEILRKELNISLQDKTNKQIRKWYQGYYAAIEMLDDCLAKVYDTLKQQGQLDNTILVFTSDHGDNLGSHRQYGKQLPLEESISVPFILRYPPEIPQGMRTDALLSPIDIMPTLLGLANMECPAVSGQNLAEVAAMKSKDGQDAILLMRYIWLGTNWITNGSGPWRGLRTKRYTYARKSDTKNPWLLFDNEKDPLQLENIVHNPEFSDLVKFFDARVDELLVAARDIEDPIAIAQLIKKECLDHSMPFREKSLFPDPLKPGYGWGIST
jgi:arylsulfatase A-like enzyme